MDLAIMEAVLPALGMTLGKARKPGFARAALLTACAALTMAAAPPPPPLRLPPPPEGTAFAVVVSEPYLELKFHDVYLLSARQSEGANEIALDFTAPVPPGLLERLPAVLPEWFEYAYSGYDSAVIRTIRQANFAATPLPDGFLLRIDPVTAPGNTVALDAQRARLEAAQGNTTEARAALDDLQAQNPRDPYVLRTRAGVEASVGDWRAAERYYALAQMEQPDDLGLRGSIADVRRELGPEISSSITYTHHDNENLVAGTGRIDYPVMNRLGILGELSVSHATGDGVELTNGTIVSVDDTIFSGAAGITYAFPGGSSGEIAALFSDAGIGARASYLARTAMSETEITGIYGASYGETAGAIASAATQDTIILRHARRVADGLWGEAALRLHRYSDDESEIARTAGFTASLRYLREFYRWTGGVSYEVEGEYLLDEDLRPDGLGGFYLPLGLRNQEIHAFSASASTPLSQNAWFDAYAGWAIDRYAGNGVFGGFALRYIPVEGLELTAGLSHSTVSAAQGSSGAVTSGGVSLIYNMQGGSGGDE